MEELNSVDNIWAGTPIPGLTIDGIMQKMGWSTIDLAKIDIGRYMLQAPQMRLAAQRCQR